MTFLDTRRNWGYTPMDFCTEMLVCMWSHFTVELLSKIGCRDIKYEVPHVVHVICSVRLLFPSQP